MKIQNNINKMHSTVIELHGEDWLVRQRVAGQALAEIMGILQRIITNKEDISLLDMDKLVEQELIKRNCTPTFKGYKGFPGAICLSVNKQLVHGVPTDEKLKNGDVISFDFGATFEGAIADSAITMIYGESTNVEIERNEITRQCLYNAIKAIRVGSRLGVIGHAIYETARKAKLNVINSFGGHGIGWNQPHAAPFVANKDLPDNGIVIQPGLTIAIEPLIVPGDCPTTTRIDEKDGWTVWTEDIGYHHEHSMYVHSDHVEIISWRPDEEPLIPRKVYFN